eukprot:SAG11_NODE_109_length_16381_cov_48.316546_10_plen_175_part_00
MALISGPTAAGHLRLLPRSAGEARAHPAAARQALQRRHPVRPPLSHAVAVALTTATCRVAGATSASFRKAGGGGGDGRRHPPPVVDPRATCCTVTTVTVPQVRPQPPSSSPSPGRASQRCGAEARGADARAGARAGAADGAVHDEAAPRRWSELAHRVTSEQCTTFHCDRLLPA